MTTEAHAPPAAMPPAEASLPNVVRSEWTKFWSLRSTYWTLGTLFFVAYGLSVLLTWITARTWDDASPEDRASFEAVEVSLGAGLFLGMLIITVLGVLVISGEYSTGGIRTTLTAVPQRMTVLSAKAIVFVAVALVASLLISFGSFFLGQRFLAAEDIDASLGDPGVFRAVLGGALFLTACGLFAFALGALLRRTAGGITAALGGLLVLPSLGALLPGDWGDTVNDYLLTNAGGQIVQVEPDPDGLGPWTGYVVFLLWCLGILAIAAALMQRRDA
jgi:ABC-type transport system involved in multi-copper enzyme maturation permease subunit